MVPKVASLPVGTYVALGEPTSERFQRLTDLLKLHHLNATSPIQGAPILQPMRSKDVFCGTGTTGLIGEAAGFISPSSAEGISYALQAWELLADAINARKEGETSR